MNEKEFDKYWSDNREQILRDNKEYAEAKSKYKMSSGADWLLFALPVVAGILFMDNCPWEKELVKWLASAGVTVIAFIVCVWIKSIMTDETSPEEVEQKIKERIKKEKINE